MGLDLREVAFTSEISLSGSNTTMKGQNFTRWIFQPLSKYTQLKSTNPTLRTFSYNQIPTSYVSSDTSRNNY